VASTVNKTILTSTYSHQIFQVVQTGQQYEAILIAGSGQIECVDGQPGECSFYSPRGMAIHEHTCYVAQYGALRKISLPKSL
jgi:hypothetical protein